MSKGSLREVWKDILTAVFASQSLWLPVKLETLSDPRCSPSFLSVPRGTCVTKCKSKWDTWNSRRTPIGVIPQTQLFIDSSQHTEPTHICLWIAHLSCYLYHVYYVNLSSWQPAAVGTSRISTSQMMWLRLTEKKWFAQSHTAFKLIRQDLNSDLTPNSML